MPWVSLIGQLKNHQILVLDSYQASIKPPLCCLQAFLKNPVYFLMVIFSLYVSFTQVSLADELSPYLTTTATKAHQDLLAEDAALFDAGFVDDRTFWVVGNHGVVLKTIDKGAHVEQVLVKKNVHWRCINVVDRNQIWLAGYYVDQRSLTPRCCVMTTLDAGTTWEEVPGCSSGAIPICLMMNAAGEGRLITTAFGEISGGYWILGTEGWERVTSLGRDPWRAAVFLTAQEGILAGRNGSYVSFIDGKLHVDGVKHLGKIDLSFLTATSSGQVLTGGDEETLYRTTNGGNSWNSLLENPPDHKSFSDLKTVAAVGNQYLWKTGSPGTFIARSTDAGKTWTNYVSGVSSTLRKLKFLDEHHGIALGDMGVILTTNDGGLTWDCVRNKELKTAMLCFTSTTAETPVGLLLKKSRDEGFRISLHGLMHHDVTQDQRYSDEDLRLEITGVETGVVASTLDHVFPLDRPEIAGEGKLLFQRWGRLLDQRDQTILNRLVARIRQERPHTILIEAPAADDQESAKFLLHRIINQAIVSANNPNYQDQSLLNAELPPWDVKYVYELLPDGVPGKIQLSALDYLPREKSYLGVLSDPLQRVSTYPQIHVREISSFQLQPKVGAEQSQNVLVNDILPEFLLSPGSVMRRNISLNEVPDPKVVERTKQIKQVLAVSTQMAADPVQGAQLLGELEQNLKLMNDQESAAYLQRVIEDYLFYGDLELGLQMTKELITRYPLTAESRRARARYFQMLASDEINYLRLKERPRTHKIQQVSMETKAPENKVDHEQQVNELIKKNIPQNVAPGPMRNLMEKKIRDAYFQQIKQQQLPVTAMPVKSQEFTKAGGIDREELTKTYALSLEEALSIKRADAELFQQPEIQFPLARVLYKNFKEDLAHELLQKMMRELTEDWTPAVRTEIWHYYPAGNPLHELHSLPNLQGKPHLDGLTQEPLWKNALTLPIALNSADELGDRQVSDKTTVKCFHDGTHFYLFADCQWRGKKPALLETAMGRQHDYNLDGQERIIISLDTDRDYFTAYQLEIGYQGQTRDQCAGLPSWNPTWYVAQQMNATSWSTEIAIPLNELIPATRISGQSWNVQVLRVIPGETLEALAHPASLPVEMKNSALLKFE